MYVYDGLHPSYPVHVYSRCGHLLIESPFISFCDIPFHACNEPSAYVRMHSWRLPPGSNKKIFIREEADILYEEITKNLHKGAVFIGFIYFINCGPVLFHDTEDFP